MSSDTYQDHLLRKFDNVFLRKDMGIYVNFRFDSTNEQHDPVKSNGFPVASQFFVWTVSIRRTFDLNALFP